MLQPCLANLKADVATNIYYSRTAREQNSLASVVLLWLAYSRMRISGNDTLGASRGVVWPRPSFRQGESLIPPTAWVWHSRQSDDAHDVLGEPYLRVPLPGGAPTAVVTSW